MASPVVFLRNIGLPATATGGRTSTVGEPSLASRGRDLFFTGNWYASRSTDDGGTWHAVDPFSALPPVDGGFCCDQTIIQAPQNRTVWLLQYIEHNNSNTLRIAVHSGPGHEVPGWVFWDLTPAGVDPAWAGQWFDYNHAAVSERFLYVGTNVFTIAGDTWTRAVVFRIPLSAFDDPTQPLAFDYFESTDNFSLRCAQGATDTMYIVSHNTMSQVRVFSWPESSNQVTATDVNVTPWKAGNYSAPGPGGRNWLGRCDPRITGVWVAQGQLGFMWTANRDGASRPLPFVRVVRLDEANLTVVDEPDIWNPQFAYAYPDASPNATGDVGVTVFRGGGQHHPSHVVGFRGQAAWSLRVTRAGTHTPTDGKWGDYLTCRRHAPETATWVAAGYTLQGGGDRQNIQPRYVHFSKGPGA